MKLADIRCRECPYLDRYMDETEGTCKKENRYMDRIPWTHPRWCPLLPGNKKKAGKEKGE